jgi:hypothetical protein
MGRGLSAGEFVERAKNAGFKTSVSYMPVSAVGADRAGWTLTLSKNVYSESKLRVNQILDEADSLLQLVPLTRGEAQRKTHDTSDADLFPFVGAGTRARLRLMRVEKRFHDQVKELIDAANQEVERIEGLSQQFESKVEGEVEVDPRVLRAEGELADAAANLMAAQGLVEQKSTEAERVKEVARREREGLREPFLFVADEREL